MVRRIEYMVVGRQHYRYVQHRESVVGHPITPPGDYTAGVTMYAGSIPPFGSFSILISSSEREGIRNISHARSSHTDLIRPRQ
jgi:hypothetical protein